jgi:DNA-directed RNA polymerase subunit RPC12/RpoP
MTASASAGAKTQVVLTPKSLDPLIGRIERMAVYTCARCGAPLGAWLRAGTLCAECERADVAERVEREAMLARPQPCYECGAMFTPTQVTARFCSAPCRLRAWRRERSAVAPR